MLRAVVITLEHDEDTATAGRAILLAGTIYDTIRSLASDHIDNEKKVMITKRLLSLLLLLPLLLVSVGVARADTIHIVQPGDTLWEISQLYGVSIEDIAAANNLPDGRTIMLGFPLIIPGVDGPLGAPTPVPAPATPRPARTYAVPDTAVAANGGVIHTVAPGDTLFSISMTYNILMSDIMEANDLENPRLVQVGRKLFIPGATLAGRAGSTAAATPAAPAATAVAAVPAAPSANLFKNGDFEGDWYFYLYNELQVPTGWQLATDEGPNTLDPGSGGLFNRPEVRVVGTNQLPPNEWDWFIANGTKAVKVFKGGAPTAFSMFQDVYLQPGRYRMTLNFFPDIVADYNQGGERSWNTHPLAGEVSIIHNDGGTNWSAVTAGQKNNRVYEFTVGQAGAHRLGAAFRNRFETANNGWFLDDWRLERIG
jgi:LysM repeat protein